MARPSTNGKADHKANGKVTITKPRRSKQAEKELAKTYNEFKEYEGQMYTGMKIGRSHKWYYDKGEWKETKITPDLWKIEFAVKKRRAGKAPKGSGVPVGTEYHWYILAHQNVRKFNANIYTTAMTGLKYKLAHKRADHEKWSASDNAQRKRLVKFLLDMVAQLELEPIAKEGLAHDHQASPNGKAHQSAGKRKKKATAR